MMEDRSKRAEKMWARKPALDNERKVAIVAYYGHEVVTLINDDSDREDIYARCPFCKRLNSSTDYSGSDAKESCKHFVEIVGGCGAYSFVFKAPRSYREE